MKRFAEIDMARGVAIIAMVGYHLVYNLEITGLVTLDLYDGFWWIFPRIIASSFLLLMGLSLTLSFSKVQNTLTPGKAFLKFLRRGSWILLFAGAVTLVSHFTLRDRIVWFGILHLIGVAVIISFPLLKYKWINLILGGLVIMGGLILGNFHFSFHALLWLGFRPENYFPADYLPMLPWYGFVLLGIFLGNSLYPKGERYFALPFSGKTPPARLLAFLGRHSLIIYLTHLPLLFGISYLLALIS